MAISPQHVVNVRGSRGAVVDALRQVGRVASGNGSAGSARGAVQALYCRMGLALLARIKNAFVIKARGGTDEAGEKWPPLSPSTIAYGRRHPGKRKTTDATRPSSALTAKQRKRWWEVYSRARAQTRDKGHAAAIAWTVVKAEGATTIMAKYGNAPVEILRDTGLLLNSLSPGVPAAVAPQTPPRQPHQVFRVRRGEAIVGTNRKGARDHHEGGRVPQRRLWPPVDRWPQSWWDDIAEQAKDGMIEIALATIRR